MKWNMILNSSLVKLAKSIALNHRANAQVSHSRDDSDPFWTILRSSQLQHLTIKKRTLSDVTYVLESMDPLFERLFSSSMTIYSSKDEQKSRFRLKVPSRRDTLTQKQSKIHMNSWSVSPHIRSLINTDWMRHENSRKVGEDLCMATPSRHFHFLMEVE